MQRQHIALLAPTPLLTRIVRQLLGDGFAPAGLHGESVADVYLDLADAGIRRLTWEEAAPEPRADRCRGLNHCDFELATHNRIYPYCVQLAIGARLALDDAPMMTDLVVSLRINAYIGGWGDRRVVARKFAIPDEAAWDAFHARVLVGVHYRAIRLRAEAEMAWASADDTEEEEEEIPTYAATAAVASA